VTAKLTALIGAAVNLPFTLFDVDGITPLTGEADVDFTKTLFRDSADETGSIPVSITEIGATGRYYAEFTPDARGLWFVNAIHADTEVAFGCYVDVGLFDTVETLRKETSNRNELDFATQEEIAYDDDGTTIIQRWTLETDGGELVTTQVGVQTKRKVPTLPRP